MFVRILVMAAYEDKKKIGEGGFGEVWLCARAKDGLQLARKRLNASAGGDALKRFQREVRILKSLDHPNIVRIFAVELETLPYWYIMPLYGCSLRAELPALIKNPERIPPIFTAVLDAIEYAHKEGVIHRDLKPENVLMNDDSDVVVSDFGLGRILDSESTRHTVTGYGLGSLPYMAPEQMTNAKHADERSDVFSLGRMLYAMYTEPLLTPAPCDYDRLPPGIAVIVRRATHARPEDRYQSVTEMKRAWLNIIDATAAQSEAEELALLRAQLAASGSVTQETVQRLMELLAKRLPDDDLLHETIMQLHPAALTMMAVYDAAFVRDILDRFAEFTGDTSWGFSYTDQIGIVCHRLFDALPDPMMRAALVECVMNVGIGHHRYYVMDVMDTLLLKVRSEDDAAVADRIERNVSRQHLAVAGGRINLAKLRPALRGVLGQAVDGEDRDAGE